MMTPRGTIQTEIGAPFKQQVKVDKVYSPQFFSLPDYFAVATD
jgi:hypothetical protein